MSTSRPSIPTESASSTAKEKQIQPIQPPKKMPNFLRNKNKRKEEIPSTKYAEQVILNEVMPTPAPTAVSSPLANSLFISAVECSTRPATVREPRSQQPSLEESRNAEVDTHQANSLGADNAHEVTQQEKLPYHETYSEFDYASLTAEDFLQYPALDVQSLPSVPKNSVISYKVLELSNAFTPEISDYKVASVINMLPELKAFQLRLLHPLESAHAEPDEDEEMEDGNMSREKMKEKVRRSMLRGSIGEDESVENNPEITVAWGDLIDARVLSWGMLGA
ncbi:hypothetical protein BKA69DRAFT_23371 [Paraphysoderma sedebokerense]|nr:hypothetical protein BKA69DRAFT_23371 [Paraphysoderma sedebokerense]